jgi:hypothetical protein
LTLAWGPSRGQPIRPESTPKRARGGPFWGTMTAVITSPMTRMGGHVKPQIAELLAGRGRQCLNDRDIGQQILRQAVPLVLSRRGFGRPREESPGPKSAPVGHAARQLNALLATPMSQPLPSGGEFGRLAAIYLRLAFTGLRQVEERFELFELF